MIPPASHRVDHEFGLMTGGRAVRPAHRPLAPASPPAPAGTHQLARGGALNLVGAACAGLAGLGIAWLVARGLGVAQAGAFFAATAAFTLAAGLAKLGTTTGLVYWIARYRAGRQPAHAAACVRVATGPVAVAALVLAAAGWVTAPWLAGTVIGSAQATPVLRTLAVFLPLAALTDAWLAATRGWHLMRPTVALDRLLRPGLQLLLLAALAAATLWGSVPVSTWAMAWALPWLPVAILAAYAVRRTQRTRTAPAAGPALPIAGTFWRFTAPRAIANVLHLALQRLDILLVAMLAGPASAAVYAVAGRFVVVGQLVNQALGLAVQPQLAERFGAGDNAAAGRLFQLATGWLVLLSWPIYLLVATHATIYLGLFGPAYQRASIVVAVLAGAMLLATGCGMVDMVLAMAGRTSWNLYNVAVALAVMIAVNLALVPRLGVLGAALGLAAAAAVNNLLPVAQVAYAVRVHPFGRATAAAAGLAAACFGVLPTLAAAAFGRGALAGIAAVVTATALYAAGAYRMRRLLALDTLAALRHRTRPRDRATNLQGDRDAQ